MTKISFSVQNVKMVERNTLKISNKTESAFESDTVSALAAHSLLTAFSQAFLLSSHT